MRAAASLGPGAHHRALPSLDGGRGGGGSKATEQPPGVVGKGLLLGPAPCPKVASLSRSFWEPQPPCLRVGVNARVSSGPAVGEVRPQRVLRGAVSEAGRPAFRVTVSCCRGEEALRAA